MAIFAKLIENHCSGITESATNAENLRRRLWRPLDPELRLYIQGKLTERKNGEREEKPSYLKVETQTRITASGGTTPLSPRQPDAP